jgi:hypothetical protein
MAQTFMLGGEAHVTPREVAKGLLLESFAVLVPLALVVGPGRCENSIQMTNVMSLPITPPKGEVIGANPANHEDWPATFVFRNLEGEYCTATAIGPRVILTAAHCVADHAGGLIETGNSDAALTCDRHPAYANNSRADFALCLVTAPLVQPKEGYETISADKALLALNDELTLLGYGCVASIENKRTYGILYQGVAKIKVLPSEKDGFIRTKGGAAVCFGDSGGGAFRSLDGGKIVRRLVGVNAQGDIETASSLAATATSLFLDWSADWAQKNAVSICGLDPQADGCRQ